MFVVGHIDNYKTFNKRLFIFILNSLKSLKSQIHKQKKKKRDVNFMFGQRVVKSNQRTHIIIPNPKETKTLRRWQKANTLSSHSLTLETKNTDSVLCKKKFKIWLLVLPILSAATNKLLCSQRSLFRAALKPFWRESTGNTTILL